MRSVIIAMISGMYLCHVGLGQTNLPVSVTYGSITLTFAAPSTNQIYNPIGPVRQDLGINTNLPLKAGVNIVYNYCYSMAQIDSAFYEIDKDRHLYPDIFDTVDTKAKCIAILCWLHGMGDRINRTNLINFVTAHSNEFVSLNLQLTSPTALADWPEQEFIQADGYWLAHLCTPNYGGGIVEHYHAIRNDGRIATLKRDVLSTTLPQLHETGGPSDLDDAELPALRAQYDQLNQYLKSELHPVFDRGNN